MSAFEGTSKKPFRGRPARGLPSERRPTNLFLAPDGKPVPPQHEPEPPRRPKGHENAMNFELTDDQLAIRNAVNDICADFDDHYWLTKDREHQFPHDFHATMAKAGWLGIAMPTSMGAAAREFSKPPS